AHQGLELPNGLQRALGHLRLIRGVRRIELAAQKQLVDRGRNVVVVAAAAQEGEHARAGVFVGKLSEVTHQAIFAQGGRNVQTPAEADSLRDGLEQLVDAAAPGGREHLSDFPGRMGQVAHHWSLASRWARYCSAPSSWSFSRSNAVG